MENYLSRKRVLVTGGSGIIGKELLKMLIEDEAIVMNADREPLPANGFEGIHSIEIDLAEDDLNELIDFKPEIIFHLGAEFERSTESAEFWHVNWQNNVILSHRIVDISKDMSQCEVFIFASSYLVYNPDLYLAQNYRDKATCLKESDPINPRNICGAAKFYTEKEIEFVQRYYNQSMRTVCARIYRVYGLDSREIINRWVKFILSGTKLNVYNRENLFDYVFSRDVAEGLKRLACSTDASGPINLSSGKARSIEAVLAILTECLPETRDHIIDHGVRDAFEASCADLTKLKSVTGWTPNTTLEEGIKVIVENELKNRECNNE
jgi:nucleoside-diphosphate-sugar epimerase